MLCNSNGVQSGYSYDDAVIGWDHSPHLETVFPRSKFNL